MSWFTHKEVHQVAEDLGVEPRVVREMEGRLSSVDTSFDAPADADDEAAPSAPVYFLEDKSADPAALLENSNWAENSTSRLHEAMLQLDERSQDILMQRWLNEEKATLHELADKYSVSAERIRQLEKNAMKKIKAAMETDS